MKYFTIFLGALALGFAACAPRAEDHTPPTTAPERAEDHSVSAEGEHDGADISSEHAGMDMGQSSANAAGGGREGMDMGGEVGSTAMDMPVIEVSPAIAQALGVVTTPVVRDAPRPSVRAWGRVVADERRAHTVQVRTAGWVERLFVRETGALVGAGDPLFEIYSPQIAATEREAVLAMQARAGMDPSGDPVAAAAADAMVDAALERLRLLGVPAEEIARLEESGVPRDTVTLTSPYSGTVLSRHLEEGMRVGQGMTVLTLADLGVVWIEAEVHEIDAALIGAGSPAAATLSHLEGFSWEGEVDFVHPVLDTATRTVVARLVLPNLDGALKPGMFADVTIGGPPRPGLWVPLDAVVRTGRRDMAFVETAPGLYQPVAVTLGPSVDGRWQVVSGLEAGQMVVSRGAFLLDAEASLRSTTGGGHQH